MHSWEWGEVKRPNWSPLRLIIDNYPLTVFVRSFPLVKLKFGYIPRVIESRGFSLRHLRELENYLKERIGLSFVLFEPNSNDKLVQEWLEKSKWKKAGHTIQPQNTNIISLEEGEEKVFSRMSGNYRKKIRRAVKHGCEVEVLSYGDDTAVERFYNIMEQIYHRTHYVMLGKEYFDKIWQEFGLIDKVKIIVIRFNGEDIGSILYLYDETTAYELYGGTGEAGRSIMANYLLKWEGIRLAIELGKTYYDQWGVAPKINGEYDSRHPLVNISKFKSGFGGEDKEFLPQYVKVNNPLIYQFYKYSLLFNGLTLKLKKFTI